MRQPLLIADDTLQKITLMQHFLQKARWDGPILIAQTSDDAMLIIDENPDIGFGLIDFYIPLHNGPSIIHHLKSANPLARVALVSSSNQQQNCDEARLAGAEACICTTFRSDEVERRMMELLEEWKNT